jgi:hypothetical protein
MVEDIMKSVIATMSYSGNMSLKIPVLQISVKYFGIPSIVTMKILKTQKHAYI